LFLLTHPSLTALGAMRATLEGLAAEKKWPCDRFLSAFNEIESGQMVQYDPDSFFLWFPNFLKHNRPESGNVVLSWRKIIDILPECQLRTELLEHARALITREFTKAFQEAFDKAFGEAFGEDMANQEQEPEPEPEQEPLSEEPLSRSF